MSEWVINSEINYLHTVIKSVTYTNVPANSVFIRLFRIGVISLLVRINEDLEELNRELDESIVLEGVSIDFDTYLDDRYWDDNFLLRNDDKVYTDLGIDLNLLSHKHVITQMTDYFPNGDANYNITQNLIDTFKTSMHQLCDRDKLGNREVNFAILCGLKYMQRLLGEIKEKVEHPKSHQYLKVWNEVREDANVELCLKSYNDWKEKNVGYSFSDLKSQQIYRIYKLLDTGFFKFYDSIIGADVKNRKLNISEDDLPLGAKITDEFAAECAKFEKFFTWKDKDILSLNYEKLGQYIYKNYSQMEYYNIDNIIEFDIIMDAIHEDMASLKPQLKQYLKGYEEEQVNVLLNDCADILNTCKTHLAKDINESFLYTYLKRLLFSKEMKDEARKKLSGQSRNTFICEIVAVLKNAKVFKVDCDKHDLAKSLSEKITSIQLDTITKNIERSYNSNEGALYHWTMKHVDDLKKESSNPFARII